MSPKTWMTMKNTSALATPRQYQAFLNPFTLSFAARFTLLLSLCSVQLSPERGQNKTAQSPGCGQALSSVRRPVKPRGKQGSLGRNNEPPRRKQRGISVVIPA